MHESTKVAILGGGKGGIILLGLLAQLPGVEIVGIADKDLTAPGLKRARTLNVPVTDRVVHLIANHDVNLLIDVTGDPAMTPLIAAHKGPRVEVLGGSAARLLWNLVQHGSALQAQIFQAEKLVGIGSFAAGIAHDINNPLQLILGLAETISEETDLALIHEFAADIIQAVKRTTATCKDLTRYARRVSADEFIEVDLNAKLDEALKIARYAARLQDLTVVKDYGEKMTLQARPEEMLHAFVNLIVNAVQATDEKGTLTLATRKDDAGMVVTIADTGRGIPPELRGRLFEPFFTTKPPGQGTGLGLYNVKSIIEQHCGKILVDSEVGKGTTFRLIFSRTP